MKWITENWSLLVVLICGVIAVGYWVRKFTEQPTDEQINKVKEWLLYAVIMAEKELGSGTGALKLRYVYSMFVDKFPSLVSVISFEMFSWYVDEVLEQMKHLLETNKDIAVFVEEG